MKAILLIAALGLGACDYQAPKYSDPDLVLQREIFVECLNAASKPNAPHYNDAAETVKACQKASYKLAGGGDLL